MKKTSSINRSFAYLGKSLLQKKHCMMKRILFLAGIVILSQMAAYSQPSAPFNRGVNFTNWFQASSPKSIPFTKFSKKDFEDVKSLGMDVVRLPINLNFMTNGAPDYILDTLFLQFLDSAIVWATETDMHLILDNHTFDPAVATDPEVGYILKRVWIQMAKKYKSHGPNIYFEVLNEPHGISDQLWNAIQKEVVDTIRTVDSLHTIIVGGANWNSYNHLDEIPIYADTNLIYTYHFYDPFIFTHQGAGWTDPSLVSLSGVPFPYNETSMPSVPQELVGTWVEGHINTTYKTVGTAEDVKRLLDIATQFSIDRDVPVFCGEFGVFNIGSDDRERANWYDTVSTYLGEHNIAWTMWDYKGGFGLFEKNSSEMFEHDLNISLVEAMNLTVPSQTSYVKRPDSVGFMIYSDFIEAGIADASYMQEEIVSFYNNQMPNNQNYCLKFANAERYNAIRFKFNQVKDLSLLLADNYALDFMFRGDSVGADFDIRFEDTDLNDTDDRPWRMTYSFTATNLTYDNGWHHVHIPLSDFSESGAWDDGAWFTPTGDFDWADIETLMIVAEQKGFGNAELWFDNIHITNMDTAQVYETNYTGYDIPKITSVAEPNSETYIFWKDNNTMVVNTNIEVPVLLTNITGISYLQKNIMSSEEIDISALPAGMYVLHAGDCYLKIVKY